MQCDYIDGNTEKEFRTRIFYEILSGTRQWILVSRIADTGLNLPNVDFAGQVDALGGSARQKTQRVGRVLRYEDGKEAMFLDVVTIHSRCDTKEEEFLLERNRFLMDQEYDFTREWVSNQSISLLNSRFLTEEVEARLMNLVTSYPDLQKKYKEINRDYMDKLKKLHRPSQLNVYQKSITKELRQAMRRSRMKEYQDRRRRLRYERDEQLRITKIDALDIDDDNASVNFTDDTEDESVSDGEGECDEED